MNAEGNLAAAAIYMEKALLLESGNTSVLANAAALVKALGRPEQAIKLEELLTKLAQAFEKKDAHDQKIRSARIKELIRFPGRVLEQVKEEK